MKFSTKSVLLLSNLILAATSVSAKEQKENRLLAAAKEQKNMVVPKRADIQRQMEEIKQKRNLQEFNIFSFNSYVEGLHNIGGISETCIAAFREINFFQTEYDLHDPLNQVGDSLVAFEEDLFNYPVPIGQIAVGDSAAKKQCRDNGGQDATLNGVYYANIESSFSLLEAGIVGILARPGLLGNYLAIIALAVGSAFAGGPDFMPMIGMGMMSFFIGGSGPDRARSLQEPGCVETYEYNDRFVCLPKDESACTDEEIIRLHAISDSTYYIIHTFDTILQYITSYGVCFFIGGPDCFEPDADAAADAESTMKLDFLEPRAEAVGEFDTCSASHTVTISNRGKRTKASKSPKGTKSPKLRKV